MGKSEHKAMTLGLIRHEMLLLSTIKSEEIRQRQRTISATLSPARSRIREALADRRCRQRKPIQVLLIEAHAILLADGDPNTAAQVYELITGHPIEPQTMRRQRDWLLKNKVIQLAAGAPPE